MRIVFRGAQGSVSNLIIRIQTDQAETVSRRIDKFADLMRSTWVSRNDYERRVRAVRDWPHISRDIGQNVIAS